MQGKPLRKYNFQTVKAYTELGFTADSQDLWVSCHSTRFVKA